jgi:MoxR-like ATPase
VSFQYKGTENERPKTQVLLEQVSRNERPEDYTADQKLAAAVNVALVLGKPLLVTGEPGTGKTELARHVAMALGLPEPERFDTKSVSLATELFYRFDNLARFHAANIDKAPRNALDFITWGPLGRAILLSLEPTHPVFEALGIRHPADAARRSVILIDEIDKAPRDFPNDLLDAIQNLRFGIRELEPPVQARLAASAGGVAEITANGQWRPVVIITSNSEKNLPAPFLRRCVYYHIPAPTADKLRAIVAKRIGGLTTLDDATLHNAREVKAEAAKPLLRSAVSFFESIRALDLGKPPATAELIDWMRYLLSTGASVTQTLTDIPDKVHDSLGVLVKSIEDLEAVTQHAAEQTPLPR